MPSRTGRWRVFALAWLLLSLLSAGWAVATPIAAAPDEPAHFVKAASVARGQFVGEPSELGHVVQVPRYVAFTHARTCFAFNAAVTGACPPASTGDQAEIIDGTTTAGLYNPLYYVVVGWPSTFLVGDVGLYAMRVVSGIFSSAFLAIAAMMVLGWRRPAIGMLGLLAGITPMLFFLSGSLNPNALEASATVAVFAAMLSITLHPRADRLTERCAVVAVAASVAVNSRGLAFIWVLLALLVPLAIPGVRALRELIRKRQVLITTLVIGLATLAALVWLFGSSSLFAGLGSADNPSTVPQTGAPPTTGFWLVVSGVFDFGRELVGIFGWLDTPANDLVYYVWAGLTFGALMIAFVTLKGRQLLVAVALALAFVFVPALIQAAYITGGGLIWQGRYALPVFLTLMLGLAALVAPRLTDGLGRTGLTRLVILVSAVWVVGHVLSFATTLRRYAVGSAGTWSNAFLHPQWTAPGGNAALVAGFTLVIVATATLLVRSLLGRERSEAAHDELPRQTADRAVPIS